MSNLVFVALAAVSQLVNMVLAAVVSQLGTLQTTVSTLVSLVLAAVS